MAGPRSERRSRAGDRAPETGAAERSGQSRPGRVEAAQAADPTAPLQRARLFDALRGFHTTHLLAFGQQSGAFQQLANAGVHGLNADELAERAGWFPAYARAFLEAAFALGVLDLASEAGVTARARYRMAPHMAEVLCDEHSPHYLGEYPWLHVLTAEDYRRFLDLHRSGKAFPYAMHGEEFLRSSAAATRGLPGFFMTQVLPRVPALRKRLEAGAHVLDVGCGAGWALTRIAEEYAKCRVVGIDAEPNAIEMAKTLIVFRNLSQRAEARLVRSEEIDYEAEFDVATLFLVLHTIPLRQRAPALAHAHRALKRGGLLLVFDEAYPETAGEFRADDQPLTVLAQWVEGTWGHRYDTATGYRSLLSEAGFRIQQEVRQGRFLVLLAEKA